MAELVGRTLGGRYQILELLGEGGMASVYRAKHIQLDRMVAVKVMFKHLMREGNFQARFVEEARLVGQLKHPNIIHVYDFEALPAEELYYMVIELINGPSLSEELIRLQVGGKKLAIEEVIRISHDIASALSYAHAQGMMHRDIKPGNVLLDGGQRVLLTDFGLGRMIVRDENMERLTVSGAALGTPAYMAPEQALGEAVDARSDLYSLGIVMYEMATNQRPFFADTPYGIVLRHINEIPQSPRVFDPGLPTELENIILRSLKKSPNERYQTADELIQDLDQLNPAHTPVAVRTAVAPVALRTVAVTKADESSPLPALATEFTGSPQRRLPFRWLIVPVIAALVALFFVTQQQMSGSAIATETVPVLIAATQEATSAPTSAPTAAATAASTDDGCMATAGSTEVLLRNGPGPEFVRNGLRLAPESSAPVIGVQRKTSNGRTWWQLAINQDSGWAQDGDVTISGTCDSVPTVAVSAPTIVTATATQQPQNTRVPTRIINQPVNTPIPTKVPPTNIVPTSLPLPTAIPLPVKPPTGLSLP